MSTQTIYVFAVHKAKSALYLAAPALGLAVQVVAPTLASVRIDAMLAKFGCVYG